MSDSIGRISLDLDVNKKGFQQDVNNIASSATKTATPGFAKMGMMLGKLFAASFMAKVAFDFGKSAIGLASSLAEIQNVVDVTFGKMSPIIDEWSKTTITQFGMSEMSAKKFSSTIGAMLKSSGITGSPLVNMSKGVAELAADFASFYNMDSEEAFNKIRSGLMGETEPLRMIGKDMSVANVEAYALSQGITKSFASMRAGEKVQLRMNYLMSISSDAVGDFARTSGGWANQTRLLTEQWKSFKTSLGGGLINLLLPIVVNLNTLILKLQTAAMWFTKFTEIITGKKAAIGGAGAVIGETGTALGDITSGAGAAGDAVKGAGKAVKGALSSFDELNVIGNDAASGLDALAGGGGGGGTVTDTSMIPEVVAGPEFDMTGLETFMAKMREVSDYLVITLRPAWESTALLMSRIWIGLVDTAKTVWQDIKSATMPVINWFATNGAPLLNSFVVGANSVFMSMFATVKSIFDTLWSDAVAPGLNALSLTMVDALNIMKGAWDTWGMKIVAGLQLAWNNIRLLFQSLWNTTLKPIWDNFLFQMRTLWTNHFVGLWTEVGKFIGKLVTGSLEIWNKFVLPLVNFLVVTLGPTFSTIFNGIVNVVSKMIGIMADIAMAVFKALGGIIDFLVGVFTGNWKMAWAGIRTVMQSVFDIIAVVAKAALDSVIQTWKAVGLWFYVNVAAPIGKVIKGAFDDIKDTMNGTWNTIRGVWERVSAWFEMNVTTPIRNTLTGMFNGIVSGINTVLSALGLATAASKKAASEVPVLPPQSGGYLTPPPVTGGGGIQWNGPKFASGALVSAPTLAMVGDNKGSRSDPEVISPLSTLQGMLSQGNQVMVEVLISILHAIESQDSTIVMDGEKLAKSLKKYTISEDSRIGRQAITVGGVRV